MENTTTINAVLEKKLDSYSSNNNDFVAAQEITVTITLNEYRDLVSFKAVGQKKIDEANSDKYTRDTENTKLREEIAALKAEIYELKKNNETSNKEDL
jgi:hypothetical protein